MSEQSINSCRPWSCQSADRRILTICVSPLWWFKSSAVLTKAACALLPGMVTLRDKPHSQSYHSNLGSDEGGEGRQGLWPRVHQRSLSNHQEMTQKGRSKSFARTPMLGVICQADKRDIILLIFLPHHPKTKRFILTQWPANKPMLLFCKRSTFFFISTWVGTADQPPLQDRLEFMFPIASNPD